MENQKFKMRLTGFLNEAGQSFADFWAGRDARERSLLIMAVMVALAGLLYALAIAPALSGRDLLSKNLPLLRQQVAQMQVLAKEAAGLSAKTASPLLTMNRENIEAALARNGLKPESVLVTGEYAKIQLAAVSFGGTLNWLEDMQKSVRVTVVDANLVALSQPDRVNATFTLRQPRND